jgi:hypothetical protein
MGPKYQFQSLGAKYCFKHWRASLINLGIANKLTFSSQRLYWALTVSTGRVASARGRIAYGSNGIFLFNQLLF